MKIDAAPETVTARIAQEFPEAVWVKPMASEALTFRGKSWTCLRGELELNGIPHVAITETVRCAIVVSVVNLATGKRIAEIR